MAQNDSGAIAPPRFSQSLGITKNANYLLFFYKAKKELLDVARAWEDYVYDFVATPQCWEYKGGRGEIFTQAKLAFLINIVTEYPFEELIALMGDKPVSISVFDKWWNIEGEPLHGNIDESENGCILAEQVDYTGMDYIDNWLRTKVKSA